MQTRGRNEDDCGVSVTSSSLSSSSDSSEFSSSSSSSGSSVGAKQSYFSQDLNEILVKASLHAAGSLLPSDSMASSPDLGWC